VKQKKVAGYKGPSRIVYEITKEGKTLLAEWMDELEKEAAKINTLITNYKKTL
jgi:DNA-binding PadR family transcriptional regulator